MSSPQNIFNTPPASSPMTDPVTRITGTREKALIDAADMLADARRTMQPIAELPADLKPADMNEVYFIQDRLALAYEEVGGWKVGAASKEAIPAFAPMPRIWITPGGSVMSAASHRYRGLEAEVAFLLAEDLPPRSTPYSREDVLGAVESCHPAIEVLESAFIDPTATDKLSMIADLQMHGGFVYGPACPEWKHIDFAAESVTLAVDGVVRVERTGSNTSGDLVGLLPWLANHGSKRTGGLKAGQWITTGSWTGNTLAVSTSGVNVHFSTLGRVTLRFA